MQTNLMSHVLFLSHPHPDVDDDGYCDHHLQQMDKDTADS